MNVLIEEFIYFDFQFVFEFLLFDLVIIELFKNYIEVNGVKFGVLFLLLFQIGIGKIYMVLNFLFQQMLE